MRRVLRATAASNAEALVDQAIKALPSDTLDGVQLEMLTKQTTTALRAFIEQGRQLAANGSQMRAERTIQVGSVEFLIDFTAGARPSIWQRLRAAVRSA